MCVIKALPSSNGIALATATESVLRISFSHCACACVSKVLCTLCVRHERPSAETDYEYLYMVVCLCVCVSACARGTLMLFLSHQLQFPFLCLVYARSIQFYTVGIVSRVFYLHSIIPFGPPVLFAPVRTLCLLCASMSSSVCTIQMNIYGPELHFLSFRSLFFPVCV